MAWFRNYWYRFGGGMVICFVVYLLIAEPHWSQTTWLLIINLIALIIHQLEEYQFPGGAPLVINRVIYDEHELTDHYPGNTLSICIVNVSAWVIYFIAIMFPNWYWLGLGVVMFSLFQILGHCVQMNVKMHTWYNPGMATALLLFLPIGIAYIYEVQFNHLVNGWTWCAGFITLVMCILLTIVLPVQTFKNKQTKYRMSDWQVERFRKVTSFARIGH